MVCTENIIYNGTAVLGKVLCGLTENVTGSLFLSLFMVVVAMIFVMLMFRIPLEFQTIIILPFLLTLMAYSQEFVAIGGIILIFLAAITARSWSRF